MRLEIICAAIVALAFCQLFAGILGSLPPEIKVCKSTQNEECIARTLEHILNIYPTGNREFGMPNIAALNITQLRISRSNSGSPIQINFEFINCTVYGLEKSKVLKVSGFDKNLKKVELDVLANLKLKGPYEMTGKLLLLPINGKGAGEILLKDTTAKIRVQMDKVLRDNKTYFKVKKFTMKFTPKKMVVKFENLFNGNPVLSATLNDVINENWKDIWTELQDGIAEAASQILANSVTSIYDILPLEEMYAD